MSGRGAKNHRNNFNESINSNWIANDLVQQTLILPDDIIINNIVPRLPVKSLIRFKSVCKLWHSTISSSEFKKSHFNFSSASANQVILINREKQSLLLVPYDEMNNINPAEMITIDISSLVKQHDRSLGSVGNWCVRDGLILWRSRNDLNIEFGYFSVYNPATHQYIEIADPPTDECLESKTFWFGYVPSIDDYKILVSFFVHTLDIPYHIYYVYSLRRGTWKMLGDLQMALFCPRHSTVFGDILHFSQVNKLVRQQKIIGFNLVTEQVKEFPLIDGLNAYFVAHFFVMKGHLSLFCSPLNAYHPIFDVWTLRKHDDWNSWEKSFSIDLHDGRYFSILNVSPTGKFIFKKYGNKMDSIQLEIVDVSNNGQDQYHGDVCELHEHSVNGFGGGFYVESLLWPFVTTESTEEDHEG